MKTTNLFSLLFATIFYACYVDVYVQEKSSSSDYPLSSDGSSYSSSSLQLPVEQEPLKINGLSYRTIKIGSLTWLTQNLSEIPSSGKWWCYGDNELKCGTYGKFYDWDAANNVCPNGWKLPSKDEWEELSIFLEGYPNNILTKAWWNASYEGYRYEDGRWFPAETEQEGYWWTSTPYGNQAYCYKARNGLKQLDKSDEAKSRGLSVRCVKK